MRIPTDIAIVVAELCLYCSHSLVFDILTGHFSNKRLLFALDILCLRASNIKDVEQTFGRLTLLHVALSSTVVLLPYLIKRFPNFFPHSLCALLAPRV